MNDTITLYLYKMANWISYPFLRLRGYRLGIEAVVDEFITLMRKVCVQGSFYPSLENYYIQYSLLNGIFIKESKYNEGVLSISKRVNKDGTMDISSQMQLQHVKAFERFCLDVANNHSSINQRWTLHYENKQIKVIACVLDIIPDFANHRNKNIDAIKMGIIFDHDFNILNISKQYFKKIKSEQSDITYKKNPLITSISKEDLVLEDELFFINLSIAADNSLITEMFPEHDMDTVVDYSNEEFKQRIKLYNMINY